MLNCIFCDQENPPGLLSCRLCSAPLPLSEDEPLAEEVFREELLRLLRDGKRVFTITAYRRRNGVDLDAAVAAIEALEMDAQFDVATDNSALEWEVIKYLERSEKIGAIRLYRERTNLGLKEATDAVEAIEIRMGLAPVTERRLGCMGMLLVLGMMVATAMLGR